LVDIDNGIWYLNNTSIWLNNIINNIKSIREYCATKYPNIDLTDIKININNQLENSCKEISSLNHNEIFKLLLNQ